MVTGGTALSLAAEKIVERQAPGGALAEAAEADIEFADAKPLRRRHRSRSHLKQVAMAASSPPAAAGH
jgi:hypothetical protein